jgi:hypothetical protein
MLFNLSSPFLTQFGIDQLHSEGALLVQGKKIPLVASLNPSADVEQTVSNLYLMEKVTVPAFSEKKVRRPLVRRRRWDDESWRKNCHWKCPLF